MGWAVGYDSNWKRDVGYGVPAVCDHPGCDKEIDRGLSYVCGSEPYGGEFGCGLYFCEMHRTTIEESEAPGGCVSLCERCEGGTGPYDAKPDTLEWIWHKLTDPTWQPWCDENPEAVAAIRQRLKDEDSGEFLRIPSFLRTGHD